jgi:hypothetical protein
MRGRNWRRWELIGLFITIGAGNLLHFVYEWSGETPVAAVFSGINESTWEHMKLLAVPWLLWTAVELAVLGGSVLAPRAAGLLTGLVLIPALYYTYTGALGVNSSLVDILIFQATVLAGAAVSWQMQKKHRLSGVVWQILGGLVLAAAAGLFVWWTFDPPQLPLFIDPTTGLAGRP